MASRNEPPSQLAASDCPSPPDWPAIDDDFRSMISPIHAYLASGELEVEEAGELFSTLLASHLEHLNVIPPADQPHRSQASGPHRQRATVKLTEETGKSKEHTEKKISI